MLESNIILTIEELAEKTGISVRTIRYYITSGLLSGPEGRGRSASYTEEHLLRLRLIRRLSDQRMSIAEMQSLLQRLSFPEVQALLHEHEDQQTPPAEAPPSARAYIDSLLQKARHIQEPLAQKSQLQSLETVPVMRKKEQWQHIELAPGLELHIRSSSEYHYRHLIRRLLHEAQKQISSEHS